MVENKGPQRVAEKLGCTRSAVQHHARKVRERLKVPKSEAQVEHEGVAHFDDGSASLVSPAVSDTPWTREGLLRHYSFDPAEWVVTNAKVNIWGDPESPQYQLKLSVVPIGGLWKMPDPAKWKPLPKPKKRKREDHFDAVVINDHHAPHHEPVFHELFVEYLSDEQPAIIEVNGDLLDFSTISRHREREAYAQSVNECLEGGFNILRDYRHACPNAEIRLKRGNHEERLRHLILDNAKGLHRIAPAGEEVPALDLRRLLHLDAMHIDYVDEEWDQAKTQISPKLTVRHGFTTTPNAGAAMLQKLAGSTVQGHSHRAGVTLKTEHTGEPDDPLRVRMALESGCACTIPGGLGYVTGGEPQWQNGCAAFRVWPNGDFHASLGIYVNGRFLAPNGKRYVA